MLMMLHFKKRKSFVSSILDFIQKKKIAAVTKTLTVFNTLKNLIFSKSGESAISAYVVSFADTKLFLFLKCNIISIFVYGFMVNIPSIATRITELFGAVFPLLFAYAVKTPPFKKWNIIFLIGIALIYFYVNLIYGKLLNPYEMTRIK